MIRCWLSRNILSIRIDENRPPPEWVCNHVHGCQECRGFYELAISLAEQLSSVAKTAKGPAPPFLQARIMSTLRASERREVGRTCGRFAWATALGLACLLTAGIVWLHPPPAPTKIANNPVATPVELAPKVNLPTVTQLDSWTKSLDTGLEQETQLVLLDARSAIDTLARSFVPEDFLASASESERR